MLTHLTFEHFFFLMQIEALSPVAAAANTFAEEYKSFATAVDATRHKLPVKNVHIGEDPEQFLGEICSTFYLFCHLYFILCYFWVCLC